MQRHRAGGLVRGYGPRYETGGETILARITLAAVLFTVVLLLSAAGIALADQPKAVDIDDLPKIKVRQGTDVVVLRIVGTSFGSVVIAELPDGRLVALPAGPVNYETQKVSHTTLAAVLATPGHQAPDVRELPSLLPYSGGVSLIPLAGGVMLIVGSWAIGRLLSEGNGE